MLAVAGVAVGASPGATIVQLEPETALALFIAPVLLDAAFDLPLASAGRLLFAVWSVVVFLLNVLASC